MPAEYDEQGNYKYPEGFDPNTNEWIAGYEKQREEWESQYAAAHELWEEHKAFVAKELENAAASAAEDGQAPKEEKVEETSNYSSDNYSRRLRPARRSARSAARQVSHHIPRRSRMPVGFAGR